MNQKATGKMWCLRSGCPQPSDIGHVEEQRLLAAVKTAQQTLIAAPKDATAWGQLGNIYFVQRLGGRSSRVLPRRG